MKGGTGEPLSLSLSLVGRRTDSAEFIRGRKIWAPEGRELPPLRSKGSRTTNSGTRKASPNLELEIAETGTRGQIGMVWENNTSTLGLLRDLGYFRDFSSLFKCKFEKESTKVSFKALRAFFN